MAGTVLVTGAGGYVGPHVVSALLDAGNRVLAVQRSERAEALDPRAELVVADLLDDSADLSLLDGVSAVVHLAWQDGFAHNSPAHMENLSAHYRFLRTAAARGVPRIVGVGSMHEIGYHEGPIDEFTPTRPLSQYGIAKNALQRSLELTIADQTSFAWARCFYIYGDDRRNSSVFTRILEAADEGRTTFPFTTGKKEYDFIEVAALGRQLAALTDSTEATGIVNCCSGIPVPLGVMVERFIAENGLGIDLQYGAFPDRAYDSPAVWGDATRIREIMARSS